MKKCALVLVLVVWCISSFSQGWRKDEMQVRIHIEKQEDLLLLHNLRINMDYPAADFNSARAYLIPAEFEKVKSLGLAYEIEIEDLIKYSENIWVGEDQYHSYQQIVDIADSLVEYFPAICKKFIFGNSLGNRQCFALKISDNVATDEPEPEVMFDGGIHGDEAIGPEIMIRFARNIVLAYGTNSYITDLIDNREIWLYLMVNPDGRENNSRYNNAGVDLNRDWQYMWDAWGGSPGPCSQPESKHLRDCMYNQQFVVHTTYHSGIVFLSCPWSYRPPDAPDWAHIQALGNIYASESGYSNLPVEPGYNGMYAINGSTKDSNYGIMGSISWSMEISEIKKPPASQITTFYNYNYGAMMAMIEHAGYGLHGTVTDASSGTPVAAIIFVDNSLPCYSDPVGGDYHKYMIPGTYSVKVMANGYQTQTIPNVQVTALNATILDVQLQPQDGHFAYRFTASQIPDNNHSDEGNTKAALGAPDNVNYSVGKNGWCVLDMQVPVTDASGPDIRVHEGDASPEGYTCYAGATMDGPWISLGTATGTAEFDIAQSGLPEARFFKILDDGDGQQNVNDAGFDLDAVEVLEESNGVYLTMFEFEIDDSNGNNNGKVDPGETVDIIVTLKNNGNVTAENVTGTLSTVASYINIITGTVNFGNIQQGQSVQGTFTLEAEATTPNGYTVNMELDVESNSGAYSNTFMMSFVVGQIPVLIVDLDDNNSSGPAMQTAIQANGVSVEYVTALPADLSVYASVFVCLGIYSDNHVLTTSEGQLLSAFLNSGGMLYMEGGDTWYYDDQTAVHAMFNINATGDGSGDLGTINGQAGAFTEGMSYSYSGENNYIDHIEPVSPAFKIFQNQSPAYGTGIAFEGAGFRTIGCSHEFGGLSDAAAPSTKALLMKEYLIFFGILPEGIQANFTANQTGICAGESVQFSDNSFGNITSWSWEFPGGSPAASIEENPVVEYASEGEFDVTLTVSDGTNTHSVTKPGFISVSVAPEAPGTPTGPAEVCTDIEPTSVFTTTGALNADTYTWDIQPSAAGVISGTGTTGTVTWTYMWVGSAEIRVKAINDCGESSFSAPFMVTCELSVGAPEIISGEVSVNVFPNPAKDYFFLQTQGFETAIHIEIADLRGRKLMETEQKSDLNSLTRIRVESLEAGMYLLKVTDNKKSATKRLLINP
ncbi:MAG: T9SS type A sorting domain-containing protein [Bacteroidales bacterium]|nr:T9SS type A sorting domain-containing protein [Bacteroidales bacterium]